MPSGRGSFVVLGAVSTVWRSVPARSRVTIEGEIEAARRNRVRAVTALDFDAYQHLTEHIDDLLEELRPLLPGQRPGSD